MTERTGVPKPVKPKGSPLFPHANGQWAKKIRGRLHYFGPWDDYDAAHQAYLTIAADLHAGRTPAAHSEGVTVEALLNAYLNAQLAKLERGEIAEKTYGTLIEHLRLASTLLGRKASVGSLRPSDFQTLLVDAAERWGVVRRRNFVTSVKSAFRWAYESEFIDQAIRFGPDFKQPPKRLVRAQRRDQMLERMLILALLERSGVHLKAMVYLGINAGFGNTDCALLPLSLIDFDKAIIDWRRPKTGIERVSPLWPETIEALRASIDARPKYRRDDFEPAFVTKYGNLWMDEARNKNAFGQRLAKVTSTIDGWPSGVGFYALRHTFRTIADEARDQHAVHRIMGHALPEMSGVYVERIGVDRLRHVTDHVRAWLRGRRRSLP